MQIRSIVPLQSPRFGAGATYDVIPTNASGSIPWPPRPTDGSSRISLTNRVSLIGFLGKDAEVKTTRNNTRFTVLSLATKRSWKDRATAEWQSKSTWHRIVCWGRLADYAAGFSKGAHLQVEGEITTREYVQKPGGNKSAEGKKSITEIRAIQIAKLARPKKDESAPESGAAA